MNKVASQSCTFSVQLSYMLSCSLGSGVFLSIVMQFEQNHTFEVWSEERLMTADFELSSFLSQDFSS